jgi:hypothetical protein
MFGEFPRLVDDRIIDAVREHVDAYVACVTSRGSPQLLVSRFTGQPMVGHREGKTAWTHNACYPSPEMHEDTEAGLENACRCCLV